MGLPALRRLRDSRNRRPRPRHPTAALEQRALAVEQPRASENLSIYGGLDLRPFCVVAGHLLPPVSTHGENGLNLSPADALLGRFRAFRAVPRTRVCVVHVRARCLVQQHNMPLCRRFVTGATGLDPATSGVTGRVGHHDVRRQAYLNGLTCRDFPPPSPPLRMVEPIRCATFGPRVGPRKLVCVDNITPGPGDVAAQRGARSAVQLEQASVPCCCKPSRASRSTSYPEQKPCSSLRSIVCSRNADRPGVYERLHDKTNFFRRPDQNIQPASTAAQSAGTVERHQPGP
jgi:hypothetical protein